MTIIIGTPVSAGTIEWAWRDWCRDQMRNKKNGAKIKIQNKYKFLKYLE